MGLTVSKGNMYGFVTHTFNTVKGQCVHDCEYCYMKRFKLQPVRLVENEFNTDLGQGNFIFVGSSCDMWSEAIPDEWILRTIEFLKSYPENKYLLQTKNPQRFLDLMEALPRLNYIYCTTIETNREYPAMGKTPSPATRAMALKHLFQKGFKTMVTVEPILDFDLPMLQYLIQATRPIWVNIGADSKGHKLPEPHRDKVLKLAQRLSSSGIEIVNKKNLMRLMDEDTEG